MSRRTEHMAAPKADAKVDIWFQGCKGKSLRWGSCYHAHDRGRDVGWEFKHTISTSLVGQRGNVTRQLVAALGQDFLRSFQAVQFCVGDALFSSRRAKDKGIVPSCAKETQNFERSSRRCCASLLTDKVLPITGTWSSFSLSVNRLGAARRFILRHDVAPCIRTGFRD